MKEKIGSNINKCKEAGCLSACCTDMIMYCGSLEGKRAYPNAVPSSFYDIDYILETCDKGVYFKETGISDSTGWDTINQYVVVGNCSHLGEGGNCRIYGKPWRPEACSNFKIDSRECREHRNELSVVIALESIK